MKTDIMNALFAKISRTIALALSASILAATACFAEVVGWNVSGPARDIPEGLSNVVAVAAGDSHTLALLNNGTVVGWGDDSWGQSEVPTGLSNVVAIAGGSFHSLALKKDGTVVGWGAGDSGQIATPIGLSNAIAIAAGSAFSMALKPDGTVLAWGDNSWGQTNIPNGLAGVVAIGAGQNHCLAVKADGTVVAWGNTNNYSSSGGGQPYVPAGLSQVVAVAGGYNHSLALNADGTVVAMGAYGNGWYGWLPATVPAGLGNVVAIAVAGDVDLALKRDGTVLTWGRNGLQTVPQGLTNLVGVAVGVNTYFLALRGDGSPFLTTPLPSRSLAYGGNASLRINATGAWPLRYQWRFNGTAVPGGTNDVLTLSGVNYQSAGTYSVNVSNVFGEITSADTKVTVAPLLITEQPQSQSTFLGAPVMFRMAAGARGPFAYQWQFNGTNLPGATGQSLVITNTQLSHAGLYAAVVSNSLGQARTLEARLAVGLVAAWGDNSSGQTNVPAGLSNAVALAAGDNHILALKADGTVVAWGANWAGQAAVPTNLNHVVAIAAGSDHSLALKTDGTVVAWGDNHAGQITVPAGLHNVVGIACGFTHCLALKSDGTVVGWGDNTWGQSTVPEGISNAVAIAAGSYHSLVLRTDGTVVGWGAGMTNSGFFPDFGQAMPPPGLNNVVKIAAGTQHSMALTANGKVFVWGDNSNGQTNVPIGLNLVTAIAAGNSHCLVSRADGSIVGWGGNWSAQINAPLGLKGVISIAGGYSFSVGLIGNGQPLLLSSPPNGFVAFGESAYLSVAPVGAIPLSYQWRFNGTNLAGATNAVLAIHNAQFNQAGDYSVVVSNAFGQVTSADLYLDVRSLTLTYQPRSQSVLLGNDAAFTVTPAGQGPFTYQWIFHGSKLPDATNATLLLTNVQLSQSGDYAVLVSNPTMNLLSAPAHLSVGIVAAWGNDNALTVPPGLSQIVAISQSDSHSLALTAKGTVISWGNNWSGQTDVPPDLTHVVAIAAGGVHSLALRSDGTVSAWGGAGYPGVTNVPVDLSNVVAIAAGNLHSLALRADGSVETWGYDYGDASITNIPAGLSDVVAIACGVTHSLALKADGTVVAWGNSQSSQTNVPSNLKNVIAIAGGANHSIALRADGTVATWGAQYATNLPFGLSHVVAVGAAQDWSLMLKSDGSLAKSTTQNTPALPKGLAPVAAIACGGNRALALLGDGPPVLENILVDRKVAYGTTVFVPATAVGAQPFSYQWRFNGVDLPDATNALLTLANVNFEQAGKYSVTVSNAFGQATSTEMKLSVASLLVGSQPQSQSGFIGGAISLSVNAVGQGPFTYQWLFNGTELAGATNSSLAIVNAQASQAGSYSVVISNGSASVVSSPAVLSLGTVAAWGDNGTGQTNVPPGLTDVLSLATGPDQSLALKSDGTVVAWGAQWATNLPSDLSNIVAIASGSGYNLALKEDGNLVTWGYGLASSIPPSATNLVAIAAGTSHALALKADGTVVAWGDSYMGKTNVPVGLANVVAIAAGQNHSLALRADGKIIGWGDNSSGQLNVPKLPANVVAIAAGDYHSLALKADGTVVAWGANGSGQTSVPSMNNVVAIACGSQFSLALKADGTLVSWGDNSSRQRNPPSGLRNLAAIAAGGSHVLALIGDGPPIVSPLIDRTAAYGSTVYLKASALGSKPMSYQWQFEGRNIPGATNAVLALTNLLFSEGGAYTMVVSNALGQVTSAPLNLNIAWLLITDQPKNATTFKGGNAVFSVTMEGYGPSSYQWQFNDENLAGATNSTLPLNDVQLDQAGTYSVILSNFLGTLKSQEATLAVGLVAAWGNNDNGQTNIPPNLTNAIAVAAAGYHCLALNRDGSVVAWGADDSQQSEVPYTLSNIVSVAAGFSHSLALDAQGHVTAWGANWVGQATVPPGLSNVVAIAGGDSHSLALKADGTVVAWGDNSQGQTNVPAGLDGVVAVAAGSGHSLALRADGRIVAWGDNSQNQATVPLNLTNAVAIAAGSYHSLALRADGTVAAWGATYSGQSTVPPGLSQVMSIAAGGNNSLALKSDGKLVTWGENSNGQNNVPAGLHNVSGIALGNYHTLALVGDGPPVITSPLLDRALPFNLPAYFKVTAVGAGPLSYQWRYNGVDVPNATNSVLTLPNLLFSQAGTYSVLVSNTLGAATSSDMNLDVGWLDILSQPQDISTFLGANVTFSVTAEGYGLAYQWQFNGTSLPGATNRTLVLPNVQIEQSGLYTVVISNFLGVVRSRDAELSVGQVAVWSNNNSGQTNLPKGLTNIVAIAAGYNHCLALRLDGTVLAWGADYAQQTDVPASLANVVAIAAGPERSLALTADGTLTAWGDYGSAQANLPIGLSGVVAVACGANHNLALRYDGTVVGWGDNSYGQAIVPVTLSNVVALAAGQYYSLALNADGTLVVWGSYYNPGSGNFVPMTLPPGLANIIGIASGNSHGLALRANRTVVAWGDNTYAQRAIPAGLSDIVALSAGDNFSLALRANGTVTIWGDTSIARPPLLNLRNVSALAARGSTWLALLGESPPITAAPLTIPDLAQGNVALSIPTQSGRVYALEFSESLEPGSWTPLPLSAGNGSLITLQDPIPASTQRFYRVRRW